MGSLRGVTDNLIGGVLGVLLAEWQLVLEAVLGHIRDIMPRVVVSRLIDL